MFFSQIARAAGAIGLAIGLSGCIDVSMDVEILGDDLAQVTSIQSMKIADYEGMAGNGVSGFCDEDEGTLEIDDVAAHCVSIEKGDFSTIFPEASSGEPQPSIARLENGTYRVTFPTGDLKAMGDGADDQMIAVFSGHNMTIKISGGEIVETNMVLAEDGQSASLVLPFDELFAGMPDLADESFAVLKLN